MKILLVGSGGREHALAWKLLQSERCDHLYVAPGNAGIAQIAQCVPIKVEEIDELTVFAKENDIGLVVVGPEVPLVMGLADKLKAENIPVFGPSAKAAQLEGSKGFMKDLCKKYNIPTASYERFTNLEKALAYIEREGAPIVIKADGLAAGKGVIVAETLEDAKDAAKDMLSGNSFGNAGASIVVEEFMEGEEVSFFAICDGEHVLAMSSAQDHKRVFDGDKGPNTGGMGAYSPARLMTPELKDKIMERIIHPTVDAMKAENMPFTGVLFAGLMIVDGEPKLIEYNARFGDPECQTLMLRLQSDLVNVLEAAATGQLNMLSLTWSDEPAICVVMAADGYPGAYKKNTLIRNLDAAAQVPKVHIFHAGTSMLDGNIVATGGRVLGVCAVEKTLKDARDLAYEAIDKIDWEDGFCRKDIAWRALSA
ncbi:MAG: phosphoribosylamine--glycine ligase [Micavibrio aeruginosavorus]|uniref:Phosphoribosylamine--glycine ligase n=1 Tax=Micavibrio aeruginosavorus TaxID=349221 RepID=A0A2W5FNR5_9BACT|nr:MAG: phosphoribosylamine--glycine ligase [Micavibrio aeruginosavorus]